MGIEYRSLFETRLKDMPGRNVAIVRYLPEKDSQQDWATYRLEEWVYNAADIEHGTPKRSWIRDIPGTEVFGLCWHILVTRRVWLVEPDANPPA